MKTIRLTTAQALVKFLNQQYVEFDGKEEKFVQGVFTIFGHGNVLGLGQALEEDAGDLRVYQGRNEQGMALAATAYAKQNHRRKIIACTSSVGPGAANMVTAAGTASANNIPLLLLPGDTFATRQPDPVLQQVEHYHNLTITTNDAFRAVSKYWDRVTRPEHLMTAMINAMRVLTDPANTGAVTVCLPQDVQGEAYEFPEYFFKKRVHRIDRRVPTESDIKEAVALIKEKKKPIIVCGGGVRYSEAAEALKSFSEKFNIPYGETQAGKSAVESSHSHNLGGIGITGTLASNLMAKEADLVIGVGTRYSDFTTGSKQLFQNESVQFLSINTSEYHAYKLDATKVVGDAKLALQKLEEELSNIDYKSSYSDEIQKAKEAWNKEVDRLYSIRYDENQFIPEAGDHLPHVLPEFAEQFGSTITQTEVLEFINEHVADDAIVVGAAGSLPSDLQRMWQSRTPNTYHMEYGYSCMGYEVSGALGVKLAEPEKEVYVMTGDGSYLMLHSELVTSIQERKKINIVLIDNAAFGCINNLQMNNGMGSFGTEFRYRNEETGKMDGDLIKIDFAKSAEGYGVKTYQVTTMEQLKEALEDSKKQEVSTLLDIKVLPKTMTRDFESWWNIGVAETSKKQSIQDAYERKESVLQTARKY
ncbi:3D-(3,5/4)-trihydroxycyclohexane-1,2-dione acylhydrolase (decyclizing) [Bacillus sp. JZ8]